MSRTDDELARDALNHIETLNRHINRGDLADETLSDAVSLRLAAAIEAIAQTTTEFRARHFRDEWSIMWATRDRIAHGYVHIDLSVIRSTVEHDLPVIEQKLRDALEP